MSDDEKWYCAYCLCALELSEETDCVRCQRELVTDSEIIGYDERMRRMIAADQEFNQARKDGLFR